MSGETSTIDKMVEQKYQHGFVTDIESETLPPGLSPDVIRAISARKNEPEWLLEWRLKAYEHWLEMREMLDSMDLLNFDADCFDY